MSKSPIKALLDHTNNPSNTCMRTPGQFDLQTLVSQVALWCKKLEFECKQLKKELRELKK